MGNEQHVELHGFDSFELKLGDELRGERASKGKSLLDVQRDLRIRAEYIDAIENADASAFPLDGFASGYIRSYARYLDLDPDDVYRRFCDESGFEAVSVSNSIEPTLGAESPAQPAAAKRVDDLVISTRFAASNAREARLDLGASLRGLASIMVLALLVGGLGFGGWTVVQNLQRVGFAPLPTPPVVLVTAPDIREPQASDLSEARPAAAPAGDRISLAELYASQEAARPEFAPRDGPISSIDPLQAGVFAPPAPSKAPEAETAADVPPPLTVDPLLAAAAEVARQRALSPAPSVETVRVFATADAWVRVREGGGRVLFTGTLGPGEKFELPEGSEGATLRAGNAGAVYLVINSEPFGPLGDGPDIAKNVDLTPEGIRSAYPPAPEVAEAFAPRATDTASALAQLPQE